MTRSWVVHGRCNDSGGHLTALFFSEDPQDIRRATYICATCPVLLPCLEAALERREPWGVWGGKVFRDGRILTPGARTAAATASPARGRVRPSADPPGTARVVRLSPARG